MSIRVGRCIYNGGARIDPSYPDYTSIVVLSKWASEWGIIGPYELRDEQGRIFENIWQFSKCYTKTRAVQETYPVGRHGSVVWEYPVKDHIVKKESDGVPIYYLTSDYVDWRKRGLYIDKPIRYPNSKQGAKECTCAFAELQPILPTDTFQQVIDKLGSPLNYINSRKQIYVKEYIRLLRAHPKYQELLQLLRTTNLLIVEVDTCHQESLGYYKEKYNVSDDFIQDHTMKATKDNLSIMLNDDRHPFGHGYCMAIALQDFDDIVK